MSDKHDLEALAETVRSRLIQNGQHGALAEFAKYTAAVQEELQVARGAAGTARAEAGGYQGRSTPAGLREELVEIASQRKPSDEINAELTAKLEAAEPKTKRKAKAAK